MMVTTVLLACRAVRRGRAAARLDTHDLRHTGNQFTADAGANTKELMVRMGRDSERAGLIYPSASTWP